MANKPDWVERLKPSPEIDGAATIVAERAKSAIDVEVLAEHLMSKDFLERQLRILPLLEKEKLFSKEQVANLSRPDRYKLGLARGKRIRQMKDLFGWDDEDHELAKYLADDVSPYQLQVTMFRQTLLEQTSEEQKAYWLPRQEKWEVVGAYAQTELGHGSNVQGIETTAHWDQSTKEFVIHSPTLTASKWWNGTLGRTANHAIVVAQLMLPDSKGGFKSYGPHTFIVQIRDMKSHEPLDGIVVGDINAKFGYASMDNAYCLFNQVRIPHSQMLARYSRVDAETGRYYEPENRAVVYGSMTHARKRIIMAARLALARAVTISIRYSSIRRQFRDRSSDSDQEVAVLDYPSVQIRLFPLLATAYALHYTGQRMGEIYEQTRASVDEGDLSSLIDLHSLSSGLKSLSSELAAGGVETCRRAMGGHGYGGGTGLVSMSADYLSKVTVEGDNWMITQQMARYLVKKAKLVSATEGKSTSNRTELQLSRYLQQRGTQPNYDILKDDKSLVAAFEHRASSMALKAYAAIEVEGKSWVSQQIRLHRLSNAQSQAVLVGNFFDALSAGQSLAHETTSILWLLYRLFALYTIEQNGQEFAVSGAVLPEQLEQISDQIVELMAQIRPHAVRLVDAWSFPDFLLYSALGRYDGRVYEDLFNRAHRLNPLNKITFNPDYRTDEIVMGSGDAGKILSKL